MEFSIGGIFHRRNFPGGTLLGGIFLGGIYRSRSKALVRSIDRTRVIVFQFIEKLLSFCLQIIVQDVTKNDYAIKKTFIITQPVKNANILCTK